MNIEEKLVKFAHSKISTVVYIISASIMIAISFYGVQSPEEIKNNPIALILCLILIILSFLCLAFCIVVMLFYKD